MNASLCVVICHACAVSISIPYLKCLASPIPMICLGPQNSEVGRDTGHGH